ncbi:MAG: PQQ-dependent sugar dehydrogenase, partial [Gammaproteobacteria bacterium]|nr:PQQ-dependent sugar dehydrogenase [Gammaproteobacteria bacterium]
MRRVFGLVEKFHLVAATALITLVTPLASAQDAPINIERYSLKVETLASGLASPWSVALLPDGLILITEKAGTLRVMRDGNLLERSVSGLPEVTVRGQGGLL